MSNFVSYLKLNNSFYNTNLKHIFLIGGACHPMLLSLFDFLGNNPIWGVLIENQKNTETSLEGGAYFENGIEKYRIQADEAQNTTTKVALLVGKITASSGEIVALAFKSRPNTLTIGEPSMGRTTTTNDVVELPFGAAMALTIGYDCDRNDQYYKQIIPEIILEQVDNFDNYLKDGNIMEAIRFFQE